jgi:Zn-dependent protease with chaperone function
MISDQQINSMANVSYSAFIATAKRKNAILLSYESDATAKTLVAVNNVAQRVIEAAGLSKNYNWETIIVKSSKANAFVLPNGKIVISTGLFKITQNEAGLATVLGHEVAHVLARHAAERLSQKLLIEMGLAAADIALITSNKTSRYQAAVSTALGLGATYGILLPYSRKHEAEADRIGLYLMGKAGYDPAEAITVWIRMEAMSTSDPWEFLSTHPSYGTRIENIRLWVQEANLYFSDRFKPLPSNIAEVQTLSDDRVARKELAPNAVRPIHEIGFWTKSKLNNNSIVTSTLTKREECNFGECDTTTLNNGSTIITVNSAFVETRKPDGTWIKYDPPLQRIRFPLKLGDSWNQEVTIENSTGRKNKITLKGNVIDYERVDIPAGTLMAFKIVLTASGSKFIDLWYSPEARTFVRSLVYNEKGKLVITNELVDYQKIIEPSGLW